MSEKGTKNTKQSKQTEKPSKKPLYSIMAIVFGAVMLTGVVMAFMNFKKIYDNGISVAEKTPLIVAMILTIVGAVGMSTAIALSIRLLMKCDKELAKAREGFSIDPAVLKDQRIRELPEVKKLMKRENIKRIFDAGKIEAADLSDPHVQTLIDALLAHADENGVIRFE